MMDSLSELERAYKADPGNLGLLVQLSREKVRLSWSIKGQTAAEWLSSLSAKKPWHERSKGVWRLGELGADADFAVPSLLKLLASESSPIVQSRILQVLGKIRCEASIPALIEAAKTAPPGIRWVASKALGDFGPKAKLASKTLWENLEKSKDQGLFLSSLEAYAKVAPEESLRMFKDILDSGDQGRQRAALRVLPTLGEKARPLIGTLQRLAEDDEDLESMIGAILDHLDS